MVCAPIPVKVPVSTFYFAYPRRKKALPTRLFLLMRVYALILSLSHRSVVRVIVVQ